MSQKLISWNVNGIRAVQRKDALQQIFDMDPDVVCIQEIKSTEEQAELDTPNYHQTWNPAQRKGYSGTLILSKEKPKNVLLNLPKDIEAKYDLVDEYGDPNTEGRIIAAEFDKYWVVTVYTPNAKGDLSRVPLREQWDPAFLEFMLRLEESKPVIFNGDLNVAHTENDLARPKANKGKKGFTEEERAGFQAFIDAGFIDTFRLFHEGDGHYTWWSYYSKARERNVGWRIDYFLVSESLKDKVESAQIHPQLMGSDHCPISVDLTADWYN